MALRFRRSFKIAPGLRMNLSGSGLSWSVGARGASMTFGKRGVASNFGIPGTGLYVRQTHGGGTRSPNPLPQITGKKAATIIVDDDGNVSFVDSETREPLDPAWVALAKKQAGDSIRKLVSDSVEKINAAMETLATLYQFTPPPAAPKYEKAVFDLPEPQKPAEKSVGLLGKMFTSKREAIEQENARTRAKWQEEMAQWQQLKASHEAREERKRKHAEEDVLTDISAMETQLQDNLADIAWPRETEVSFEIRAEGSLCVLDVDLPEIEHMPRIEAAVSGRGFEIKKKELSDTKRRKLYMQHIHAVAMRIVGEVFATLPTCEKVVISGYSQRPDPTTGQTRDEYLLSAGIDRVAWRQIDFATLSAVDPVAAFSRFESRRNMSKTGVFTAIEPLI